MSNLTLAKEIASVSNAWITSGVEMLIDGVDPARLICEQGEYWSVVDYRERVTRVKVHPRDIPNLDDPGTVGILLSQAPCQSVWYDEAADSCVETRSKAWCCGFYDNHWHYAPDRTTAIVRAWVAHHKGQA
jgi:hypothetical protein